MDSLCHKVTMQKELLIKFNSFDVSLAKTPYDPSIILAKNQDVSVSWEEYAKIIGNLMFLLNYTKLDIDFAVNMLSHLLTIQAKAIGMH